MKKILSIFFILSSYISLGQKDTIVTNRGVTLLKVVINVLDYGVVGDSSTDNTAALRAVFSMAKANGAWVDFPKGNYIISDTINVPYSCKITGHGGMAPYYGTTGSGPVGVYAYGNSVIIQTASDKSALVISHDGVDIHGMTIKCSGSSPSAGAGIRVVNGNAFKIQNTFIGTFYSNLVLESGVDMTIGPGNQFYNPILYNMSVAGLIPDEGCNTITGNMFNSSLSPLATQLYITDPAGIRIINNEFHIATGQNVAAGFYPIGVIDINCLATTSQPFIIGNGIEAYTQFGIRIRNLNSSVTFGKIVIEGNQLQGYGGSGVHDIDIVSNGAGKIYQVNITNNNIGTNGNFRAIYVENVNGLTLAGNNIANNDSSYSLRSDSIVNCTNIHYKIKGAVLLDSMRIRATPNTSTAGTFDFLTRNTTTGNMEKFAGVGTGTGLITYATAPTFTTNITSPLLIGGTSTTQTLTYKTTTGVATTGADHIWVGGNNGATELARLTAAGNFGIGVSPTLRLHVQGGQYLLRPDAHATTNGFRVLNSGTLASNKVYQIGILSLTNGFSMFQNASSEVIYTFEDGRVGIAQNTPTAKLHLGLGATGASTAPLKFTAGTNMTTPEAGAVEFDGTNYFVSSGSTRYTLSKTLTNTATLNFDLTALNYQDLTVTVTGAVDGDAVSVGAPNGAVIADVTYFGWVSGANTVTVRAARVGGGGAADPASGTFRVSVVKY